MRTLPLSRTGSKTQDSLVSGWRHLTEPSCRQPFFLTKSLQTNCPYIHKKLQRNPSVGRGLKIHFWSLWIWKFLIFDKCPQGCDEVKNTMGILHGPRLMTWTTKSPIPGNHWVPLGCRALLGSAKKYKSKISFWRWLNTFLARLALMYTLVNTISYNYFCYVKGSFKKKVLIESKIVTV